MDDPVSRVNRNVPDDPVKRGVPTLQNILEKKGKGVQSFFCRLFRCWRYRYAIRSRRRNKTRMINPAKMSRSNRITAPISSSRLRSDDMSRSKVDCIVERKFFCVFLPLDEDLLDELPGTVSGEYSF
jgi:hypothetical protein